MAASSQSLVRKTTALLLAAVVLLLGLAAVAPGLHTALDCSHHCETGHGSQETDDDSGADHYCAVTLLQMGATWSICPALPDVKVGTITFTQEAAIASPYIIFILTGNRGPPPVGIA